MLERLLTENGFVDVDQRVMSLQLTLPSAADALTMMQQAFGAYRAVLAESSDAVRVAGFQPGEYTFGGRTVIVEDGVAKLPDRSFFAGSTATMDRCVRTMVHEVGVGLQDAIKLATDNPARFMRLDSDRGSLAPGKRESREGR